MAANVPETVLDEQGNLHLCCISDCGRNGVSHGTEHMCIVHIAMLPTGFCDAKCFKWPQSCYCKYINMYGP